jgi:hypothetical protein
MYDGHQMGTKDKDRGTVDITERWLESYVPAPDVERVKLWDARLTGFGVVIGRRHHSFVVRSYERGIRRQVHLGHWAPGRLRAADAGIRDRTMTVAMARSAAIQKLGVMRAGADPASGSGEADKSTTLADAFALHIDRLRRKGGRPRSISTIEREVAKHLSGWMERHLVDISRTDCRELHERLTHESGPYLANRVMRHLRAAWNTAEREHDLPRCPTLAVHWNKEKRRQEPIPWDKLPVWRAAIDALSDVRRG